MKSILLHLCCGPCACYPLKHLRQAGYDVTAYFYNPNIHPYKEFRKRLETAQEFAEKSDLTLHMDDDYALEEFLRRAIIDAPLGRCRMCYDMRMEQTARFAAENGFKAFTSTLFVSPYQDHAVMQSAAEAAAEKYGVAFVHIDFRQGWKEGVEICRTLELYRQPYCGCIYSEKERYCKPKKAKGAAP